MLTLIGLASTASILWGVTAILHKKMLNHMSPCTLIFLIGILFGIMSIIFACFFKKNIVLKDNVVSISNIVKFNF